MAVLLWAPAAHADRSFSPRFSVNTTGDLAMAANALLSCDVTLAGCPEALAGARGAKLGNNAWAMRHVDVDADPATFNSSRAELVLPAGADVLFAGLYWGADTARGTRGAAAPDAGARGRVLLAPPGGAYGPVNADVVDASGTIYQGFAAVTDRVRAAGTYTVANVQSGTGPNRYGGWALVVAYRLAGAQSRNLTVFDGFVEVKAGDAPRELPLSGFRAPAAGPVRTTLGYVAYEGDRSATGDAARLDQVRLVDSVGDANNAFNSTIDTAGARTPRNANQLGFDADVVALTDALPHGARSTAVRLETTFDGYRPGMVFFATDLFAPALSLQAASRDVNGGLLETGDELEYTFTGVNSGEGGAVATKVVEPIPAGTTLVSLPAGARHDVGSGQVVFDVGRLAPGAAFGVGYRVRVNDDVPNGTVVVDPARVTALAEDLGFPLEVPAGEVRDTVVAPDLAIGNVFAGINDINQVITYTYTVTNVGGAASRGSVSVTDAIPAGMTVQAVAGAGWSCDPPAAAIRCVRSDALAAGAAFPPIVVTVLINTVPPLPNGFVDTVVVSGGGDFNAANDTLTLAPPAAPLQAVSVENVVTPGRAAVGEVVTYLVTVNNDRAAATFQLSAPLPAGLSVQSVEPLDGGTCTAAVACALPIGSLGNARVRIRATVTQTSGTIASTATVNVPSDPLPADNTATATVDVRTTARVLVTKELDGVPREGGPVRWLVTIVNAGPSDIPEGSSLDDLVPPPVAGGTGSAACNEAARLIGCTLPAIPAGGRVTVAVTGELRAGSAGRQLPNGVQVVPRAIVLPPVPQAATPPGEVVVARAADLGVAHVGTDVPVARDGVVTYHVRATNHGPSAARDVVVRDRLPAGSRLVRAPAGCAQKGRVVGCRLGRLAVRRQRVLQLVARLDRRGGARSIVSTASVDGALPDRVTANDRDRSRAALAPRLALRITPSRRTAAVGDLVTYTLRLTNRGPGTAAAVRLCTRPGQGLALPGSPGARSVCFRFGSVRAGRTVSRTVLVRVRRSAGPTARSRVTVRIGGVRVATASTTVGVGPSVAGCSAAAC